MGKFNRIETGIDNLVIVEPTIFGDERGFFMESYSKRDFEEMGLSMEFVQDNHSKSKKGVLRGLHFQSKLAQGKLVRVVAGSVLDVAVDLRRKSPTFGQVRTVLLTAENKRLFYVPEGFAHGFVTLEDNTEFQYKCTNYYAPEYDSGIIWNDKDLNIDWQLEKYGIKLEQLSLSGKDKKLQTFKEFVEGNIRF